MNSTALRPAVHIAAVFGMYLSVAMLVPAAADLYTGSPDWRVFTFSAVLVGGLGLAVAVASQGSLPPASTRFGFLVVNFLWATLAIAGAVPFMLSSLEMNLADAIFESVSGITTTGSTVIVGLDTSPPGILLWRSLLNWMGGLGVIALGLFLLPFLHIGGVSYLKLESSDIEDRPFARFATFMVSFISIYAALTLACTICFALAGMPAFDALNHAMATLATGGFSTHDSSFGPYAEMPVVLWTGTIFMFIGGLPFSILILFAIRGRFDALRDPQIRVYAAYVVAFAVSVAIYLRLTTSMLFGQALTQAAFNLVSIITTTGFASTDYTLWGPFAVTSIFFATFLGGCSGSTTGGIKAHRFLILFEMLVNGLRRLVYPSSVQTVRYGERPVSEEMQRAVVLFISSFFVVWATASILLSATGLDLLRSTTGALTA